MKVLDSEDEDKIILRKSNSDSDSSDHLRL